MSIRLSGIFLRVKFQKNRQLRLRARVARSAILFNFKKSHTVRKALRFPRYNMRSRGNVILHEIFRVVSHFSRYISCYIAESRLPLGQCSYLKNKYFFICRNLPYTSKNTFPTVAGLKHFYFFYIFDDFNVKSDQLRP